MNPCTCKIKATLLCMISGLWAFMSCTAHSSNSPEQNLAREILQDKRMDKIVQMGNALLASGLTAGSVYQEVWIRDLNTFVVPLLHVADPKNVREALLTFFHFQGKDGNIVDGYIPIEVTTQVLNKS